MEQNRRCKCGEGSEYEFLTAEEATRRMTSRLSKELADDIDREIIDRIRREFKDGQM